MEGPRQPRSCLMRSRMAALCSEAKVMMSLNLTASGPLQEAASCASWGRLCASSMKMCVLLQPAEAAHERKGGMRAL